jgi:hypothetical protein
MSKEIRRTRTADAEMDAIVVLNQVLEPLDRAAAKRVLTWADKRYVNPDFPVPETQMDGVSKFFDAIQETAREMHVSPPAKILDAMALVVQEMREQGKIEAHAA